LAGVVPEPPEPEPVPLPPEPPEPLLPEPGLELEVVTGGLVVVPHPAVTRPTTAIRRRDFRGI